MRRLTSFSSILLPFARGIIHPVNAKTFESDVLQSQKAVCLVFHISQNAACQQYLSFLDAKADELNEEAGAAWLKVCAVDGDTNRNLASALSVQRAKLPTAFFIMQATIIDKVVGNVPQQRMETILRKFSEHYHTTLGFDLQNSKKSLPLAAAATADLTSGTPTPFLLQKITTALVGAEMIHLPKEADQLEGIKKLIQQTKQKAYHELEELHRSAGLDVKRLSDEEMEAQYFSQEAFKNAAWSSALEALFLARVYGSMGQIEHNVANNASLALRREFPQALRDPQIKTISSLIDVNILRGKLRQTLLRAGQLLESSDTSVPSSSSTESAPSSSALEEVTAYEWAKKVSKWIDFVDSRTSEGVSEFPASMVEEMFTAFKQYFVKAKKSDTAATRASDVQLLLVAVIQMFPKDPQSAAARSRLSSMIF